LPAWYSSRDTSGVATSGRSKLRIDRVAATERLNQALQLSEQSSRLPPEWIERSRCISQAASGTFVPVLGTALLAKATDPRVDPTTLKSRASDRAYSARGLAKDVLAKCCKQAGIDLGTGGDEPLNNQPFLSAERITLDLNVHQNVRADFAYLVETVRKIDSLDADQALAALSAFLRVRRDVPPSVEVDLSGRTVDLLELLQRTSAFVGADPEGGKRGQAFIAATLGLVFEEVRTKLVNDPSRGWPGDVGVIQGRHATLAAEVRQKPVGGEDVLGFVSRCARRDIRRAVVAALAGNQLPLPIAELQAKAWRDHGVSLTVWLSVEQVLQAALVLTHLSVPDALLKFPRLMLERLRELRVSREGLTAWAAVFSSHQT